MKNKLMMLLVLGMVIAMSSCTTFKVEGMQVTKDAPMGTEVGTFETTVKVVEFLAAPAGVNLLNLVDPASMNDPIRDAIKAEIEKAGGDAAVNVTIDYGVDAVEYILSSITYSLYSPSHATITGTIVKY